MNPPGGIRAKLYAKKRQIEYEESSKVILPAALPTLLRILGEKEKEISLLSYEELKIKDVLCLPAKVKVMSLVMLNIMYIYTN